MVHLLAHKKAKSGFTLIELLVVIAIIGVLATIVLASLNNARVKARDARRITDIKQIQIALELNLDGAGLGSYPVGNSTCDTTDSYGLQILVTRGYISIIPRDPSNSAKCYGYRTPVAPATSYHLGAILEDTNNKALTQDKDCDDSIAGGSAGSCTATGPAFTLGGNGSAAAAIVGAGICTAAGTETCFDVTP